MKHTMSESVYASSNRKGAFVRNGRLVKAVTLALVLGFSGVVGGMVQAAGVTDTTEKGGVAVNLSDDTQKAQAKGISSIAEGEGAIANAEGGIAIGKNAFAGKEPTYGYAKKDSIAIGNGAEANYDYNIAIGSGALTDNKNAVAIGNKSQAKSLYTVAIGDGAISNGTSSLALGRYTYVKDKYSAAIGELSSADGEAVDGTSKFIGTEVKKSNGVVSVGTKAREYDDNGTKKTTSGITRRIVNVAGGIKDTDAVNVAQLTAVANQIKGGSGNQYLSIKPGKLKKAAKATGSSSIAIGDNAQSDSNETIVIGENAEAMKYMWTQPSTGKQFEQTSARSIAIGNNSKVVDTDAVALGYGAQALYNYSVAVGGGALADKGSAIAIGGVAKVLATDAIAIGQSVKVTAEAEDGVAIGYGAHLGYDKFDDPRIADKKYINPKTELEQLQKTPTILMAEEKYGDFSSISGDGSADDTPSVPTKKGKPIPEVTRGAVAIGHWSTASGYNAVSIGSTSRSYGMDSVALGSSSKAFLDSTVAIGDKALATKARSTAIGDMAMTEAADSIAMGTYARVTDKNSVSLGKYSSTQGTALMKDTQAAFSGEMVSKDAGVISVGTQAYTEDYKTGNVGKPDSIKTEKRNIPEMKRRIVNVAGGINPNDAVNVKQLTAVAESPVYIYSGGSSNESKVYSRGTQVKTTGDKDYTISNLSFAFTDGLQAETVTENGKDIVKVGMTKDYMTKLDDAIKGATDATNAANTAAEKANTAAGNADTAASAANQAAGKADGAANAANTAAGEANKATGAANDAAENATKAATGAGEAAGKANEAATNAGNAAEAANTAAGEANKATGAANDAAENATKAATGAGEAAGKANEAATNAGNAAEAANTAANDAGKAAVKANEAADNANKAAERVNNAIGDMKGSGIEAGDVHGTKDSLAAGKGSDVKADEGTAIGNGAKVTDKATNSVAIGAGSVADRPNTVSVGSEGHERVITNVAPGLIAKDSTDAVNGGQLYAVEQKVDTNTERIGQVAQQVGNNTQAIRDLRKESRKGDAMNAALAALKPVAYNPAEPTQIMAGVGFNHGEQAVAIGAAHYVNGRTMLNAGIAYAGNSDVMANVGVTWRVGQGEVPEDKAVEADKAAAELNSRVQSLEQTVNEQREQIEKLMALLQAK